MEERLADLRQRLDKTRDLRRAELLKGASQGRELVEGYDKEVADYLSEIMSLQVIVGTQKSDRERHAELSEWWRKLPSAKMDEKTRIMDLPAVPADLSFMPPLQRLYVRKPTDTLVTGTPGTGKSTWQYHLLQHLAYLGRSVVLDWANCNDRLLFCQEGAFTGSKTSFKKELADPNNYYLVDGQLPKNAKACRIETCSPMHIKQWEFVKEGARRRIMPIWSLEELEAALPLFPGVSRERLHELYSIWGGGSVRWTLARANQPHADEIESLTLLNDAIGRSTLPALQRAVGVGGTDATQEVSSLLVHYVPDEDMIVSRVVMASQYVSDRVCETLLANYSLEMKNFLTASTGDSALSVLRGNLFESYTYWLLHKGGQFTVRYFDTGMEEDVEVPKGSSHCFWDLSEVADQPNATQCRPRLKSFPSIDFIRQPDDLVQVTMNLEHDPPEASVIRKCLQVLRAPAEEPRGPAYLTFAVPPDVYTNFKQPRLKGPLSKEKFPIRQRVMRIPLMRMRALAFNPLAI